MRRYIEIYSIMLRNSLIREMSFKANFLLWMVVEILWFCGQIVFFSIIFGNVDHIGDWTKWEVVLLVGTHQIIAQLFQAFFFVNVANIPELVRTGKLDSLLVLPIDSQFALHQTIRSRQYCERRARWPGSLRFAIAAWDGAHSDVHLALSDGARIWRGGALLHHARAGGGEFPDRTRTGTCLWLF